MNQHDCVKPIFIAIEGCCLAGKTTLLRALRDIYGYKVIKEHASYVTMPRFPPHSVDDVHASLQYLLIVETKRASEALGQRSTVVFDRSAISFIVFEYAKRGLGYWRDLDFAIDLYYHAMTEGNIIEPEVYIYLKADHKTMVEREKIRGRIAMEYLINPHVVSNMQEFYDLFFLECVDKKNFIIIDASQSADSVVQQAVTFLRNYNHSLVHESAWKRLLDLNQSGILK